MPSTMVLPSLPAELVDYIFDLAVYTNDYTNDFDDTRALPRLALINRRVYRKVIPELYRTPRLNRLNMDAFLDTLEEDLFINSDRKCFAHMVESIAFMSAPIRSRDTADEYEHEHAPFPSVLRCLTLVNETVRSISIDMSCSQAACGCEIISSGKEIDFGTLSLPNLSELSCRCPKGYMPPCTRKLLEQHIVGQAASLVDLKLFWTAPGPYGSASNVESSLNKTLRSCPNVNTLSIIDAQDSPRIHRAVLHSTVVSDADDDEVRESGFEVESKTTTFYQQGQTEASESFGYSAEDSIDEQDFKDGAESIDTVYEDCSDEDPLESQALASHAQADSEAPPITVSASVKRVVSRLGREQGLQSRLACVYLPEEPESPAEARRAKNSVSTDASSRATDARRRLIIKNRLHFERDRGWEALVWMLRRKHAPVAPSVA